ncbi:MAG: hypothetical protein EGQ09_01655, partial [Clostridiales bacterium]|nr:hypothetical protein [Clostridiales bacterium]
DEDVIAVPEYEKNVPPEAKLLRLCSLESYLEENVKAGEGQVLLVHTQEGLPEGFSCSADAVVVSHPYSYGDFRATFLDLPAGAAILEVRREKMFEAFLASYDLAQFARRSSAVLGNPVIITNADMRLLATAGEFPADAPDVQEVLSCGYDIQVKLDSSCAAKIHAGTGRLKINNPNVAQDPEVKFILDMDLSMGGNTPCGLAAAALETLHGHSSRVFEGVVTDTLRDAMGRA